MQSFEKFFKVPNNFIESTVFESIAAHSIRLYLFLCKHANADGTGYIYHEQIKFIAKQYIYIHINELKDKNIIEAITNKKHHYIKYKILPIINYTIKSKQQFVNKKYKDTTKSTP